MDGNTAAPTVLTDVPPDAKVCADEVFGPVLVPTPAASDEEGLAAIGDSAFGRPASSPAASTWPSPPTAACT